MSNDLRFRATMDDKVSGTLDKMRDKFDLLGKSKGAQSILAGVGLSVGKMAMDSLGGAIGTVTDLVQSSIKAASDMAETQSKVNVVFGQSAKDVDAFGTTAAKAIGLSQQAAEEAAASIGNLLLSTGTAPAKIAPMSTSLVKLAGDLASFNNIPVEDALAKLQSGIVGQERPLRELGVAISAASVDTEAAALGFHKLNGQFSEGEKVQARYSLIFKQTTTAQGDFARTSDQLANSTRTLNAEMEDMSAKMGKALLPVQLSVTRAQSGLIDAVTGGTRDIVQGLEQETANMLTAGVSTSDLQAHYAALLAQKQKLTSDQSGTIVFQSEIDSINRSIEATQGLIDKDKSLGAAARAARDDYTGAWASIGKATDDARPKVEAVAKEVRDAGEAIYYAKVAADKATPAMRDYFDRYSAIVGKGDIATTTLNIMADKDAVANAAKAMEKATPGTLAYRKAQLELAVAQGILAGDTITLRDEQAKLYLLKPDKANTAALKKFFDGIGLEVNNLTGDAKAAYDALARLLGINVSAKQDLSSAKGLQTKDKHRASGGPVYAGETYTVGEKGPETLVMGNSGGTIVPHGGGSPIVIQVNLPGIGKIAEAVDEHLYYKLSRSAPFAGRP